MKPRRWRQISLSTVIAVTIAAGVLVHLNFKPHPFDLAPIFSNKMEFLGWPMHCAIRQVVDHSGEPVKDPSTIFVDLHPDIRNYEATNYLSGYRTLFINITVALLLLFTVGFATESIVRHLAQRRAAKVDRNSEDCAT